MPIYPTVRRLPIKSLHRMAVAAGLIGCTTAGIADESKLEAYGRHLARECTSCHRLDGVDNGIPSIVGWPPETFVSTMKFYSNGARTNPVMVSVAGSLNDEQLKALALFFASVPPPEKRSPSPAPARRKP